MQALHEKHVVQPLTTGRCVRLGGAVSLAVMWIVTSEVVSSHVGLSAGVCLFYVHQMEYIHSGIGPPM